MKYSITYHYLTSATVEVEAEDEMDAIENGRDLQSEIEILQNLQEVEVESEEIEPEPAEPEDPEEGIDEAHVKISRSMSLAKEAHTNAIKELINDAVLDIRKSDESKEKIRLIEAEFEETI